MSDGKYKNTVFTLLAAQESRLDSWLTRLEQLHPVEIDLGLARVSQVAAQLDLLNPSAIVITIAGTNGKGSTAAALQALLLKAGMVSSAPKVGCFTSPHFLRFNERIAINGVAVSDDSICDAFEAIEQARGDISLTYFEFATLAAFCVFKREQVDYMILEVGLGGRLDAVNILEADVAIITSIALDHQSWLGDTLDEISLEKGGILRDQQSIIFGQSDMPRPLMDLARDKVKAGGRLYLHGTEFDGVTYDKAERRKQGIGFHGWLSGDSNSGSAILKWQGSNSSLELSAEENSFPLHLSAWSAALQACASVDFELDNSCLPGVMQSTSLTGRLSSHEYQQRVFLCDVAHNAAAVKRLVEVLGSRGEKNFTAIFSALSDKPIVEMLKMLCPVVEKLVIPALTQNSRAVEPKEVVEMLKAELDAEELPGLIETTESVDAAINWAIHATQRDDKILVLGSFLTVAECLACFDSGS